MDVIDRILDPIGWLVSKVRDYGLENLFSRYYGIYRGIVVDIKDPEKRGRVKVQVPAIGQFEISDTAQSNWALPNMDISVGDPDKTDKQVHGDYNPPDLYDQVWVMFENGDSRFPVYGGGWIPDMKVEGKDELISDGNKVKIKRTRGGHQIRLSDKDKDNSISIIKGDGKGKKTEYSIIIDNNGKITLKSKDGKIEIEESKIGIETKSGAKVLLDGANISLSDSSGDKVELETGKVTLTARNKISLNAPIVELNGAIVGLGKGANQPALTGTAFTLAFMTHIHSAPDTPPIVASPITVGNGLSTKVKIV